MLMLNEERTWQTVLSELDTMIATVENPIQIVSNEEDKVLEELV